MSASQVTDTITIIDPVAGEVIVTIKKLNWKKLRDADRAQTEDYYASVAKAPKSVVEGWQKQADQNKGKEPEPPKDDAAKAKALEERYKARAAGYDRDTCFRAGVKSVSIPDVKDQKQLYAWLDDLDEENAAKIHRAIVDSSLPSLEPEVEEAARKND
jgi:hypothetical protein